MGGQESTMRASILAAGRRHLPVVHFSADSAIWILGVPFATWLRYDFRFEQLGSGTVTAVVAAIGLQAIVGTVVGVYRQQWRYGTFDEAVAVACTALLTGTILTALFWSDFSVPRSVPVLATGIALFGQISVRSFWRLYKAQQRQGDEMAHRIVIVGAGGGAEQILRTFETGAEPDFVPVAIVDDDPMKQGLRLSGVRVRGKVVDLRTVADRYRATAVLIATPSAPRDFIASTTRLAEEAELEVFILPPLERMLGGITTGQIRPITHEDLLGRPPAEIDTEAIADYITGRRVLVTGAGGSIGSELCRQLARFEPSVLLMLDRDESGIHSTQLSIEGRAMLDSPNLLLADIRDSERVDELFAEHRPDVVFHTAALKHLPLLEQHPDEGWKTNVLGTLNLLEAAARHGADRFVNISTDKAANPTSVLGYTKRITERLTSWANELSDTVFVSVRFGNVLGSNGSVLKAFEAQAANGGPITVTHPDVTRYFMTIEEASRLTVMAGAIGEAGEVMILDMGEPVKIVDVAGRFARQHEPPLQIVFTGLRPNEKLDEDLVADDETGERHRHPLITHVTTAGLSASAVRNTAPHDAASVARATPEPSTNA